MDESFVTNVGGARDGLVSDLSAFKPGGGHLQAGGVSPLSLLTFFAAAKKVGAAPHRGNASKPPRKQGKANPTGTAAKPRRRRQTHTSTPKKARRRQKPTSPDHIFSTHPHDFAAAIYAQNPSSVNIR
jgi:hypothetical protein